jgi:hypothetical protein
MNKDDFKDYSGGCHCKRIKWLVKAPKKLIVFRCNCSICLMKQNHHFIVPKENFVILEGEEFLTLYSFNTHQAQHKFCKYCGVQSFYHPRSNPKGVAVTIYCLDILSEVDFEYVDFDGKDWEIEIEKKSMIKKFSDE